MTWSQLFSGKKKAPPLETIAALDQALRDGRLEEAAQIVGQLARKTGQDPLLITVCAAAMDTIAKDNLDLALKTANDIGLHAEGAARRTWNLRQVAYAGRLAETDYTRGIRALTSLSDFINPEEQTRHAAIEKLMEFSRRSSAAYDGAPMPRDAAAVSRLMSANSIAGTALINMPPLPAKIRKPGDQARVALNDSALAQWSATADALIAVAPAAAAGLLYYFASHAAGSYSPATEELPVMTGEKFLAAAAALQHSDARLAMESARNAIGYGVPAAVEKTDLHGHAHGHGHGHSHDDEDAAAESEHDHNHGHHDHAHDHGGEHGHGHDHHHDHDEHGHDHHHDHDAAPADLETRAVAVWRHAAAHRAEHELEKTLADIRQTASYAKGPLKKAAVETWTGLIGKLKAADPKAAEREIHRAAELDNGKATALSRAAQRELTADRVETAPAPLSAADFLKRHGKPQP